MPNVQQYLGSVYPEQQVTVVVSGAIYPPQMIIFTPTHESSGAVLQADNSSHILLAGGGNLLKVS